jgi:hypothetical protein
MLSPHIICQAKSNTNLLDTGFGPLLKFSGKGRRNPLPEDCDQTRGMPDNRFTVRNLCCWKSRVKTEIKLKVLGTRHCFNNIADSKDGFLSLKAMDKVIAIDPTKRTVTVGGGITYVLTDISEIRTIAADTLWMSPFYDQDCVTIHFTWKPDWPAVSRLSPVIEKIEKEVAPFNACPHWEKLFTTSPAELKRIHNNKKMPEFIELSRKFDPLGKFRNPFLKRNIFGS